MTQPFKIYAIVGYYKLVIPVLSPEKMTISDLMKEIQVRNIFDSTKIEALLMMNHALLYKGDLIRSVLKREETIRAITKESLEEQIKQTKANTIFFSQKGKSTQAKRTSIQDKNTILKKPLQPKLIGSVSNSFSESSSDFSLKIDSRSDSEFEKDQRNFKDRNQDQLKKNDPKQQTVSSFVKVDQNFAEKESAEITTQIENENETRNGKTKSPLVFRKKNQNQLLRQNQNQNKMDSNKPNQSNNNITKSNAPLFFRKNEPNPNENQTQNKIANNSKQTSSNVTKTNSPLIFKQKEPNSTQSQNQNQNKIDNNPQQSNSNVTISKSPLIFRKKQPNQNPNQIQSQNKLGDNKPKQSNDNVTISNSPLIFRKKQPEQNQNPYQNQNKIDNNTKQSNNNITKSKSPLIFRKNQNQNHNHNQIKTGNTGAFGVNKSSVLNFQEKKSQELVHNNEKQFKEENLRKTEDNNNRKSLSPLIFRKNNPNPNQNQTQNKIANNSKQDSNNIKKTNSPLIFRKNEPNQNLYQSQNKIDNNPQQSNNNIKKSNSPLIFRKNNPNPNQNQTQNKIANNSKQGSNNITKTNSMLIFKQNKPQPNLSQNQNKIDNNPQQSSNNITKTNSPLIFRKNEPKPSQNQNKIDNNPNENGNTYSPLIFQKKEPILNQNQNKMGSNPKQTSNNITKTNSPLIFLKNEPKPITYTSQNQNKIDNNPKQGSNNTTKSNSPLIFRKNEPNPYSNQNKMVNIDDKNGKTNSPLIFKKNEPKPITFTSQTQNKIESNSKQSLNNITKTNSPLIFKKSQNQNEIDSNPKQSNNNVTKTNSPLIFRKNDPKPNQGLYNSDIPQQKLKNNHITQNSAKPFIIQNFSQQPIKRDSSNSKISNSQSEKNTNLTIQPKQQYILSFKQENNINNNNTLANTGDIHQNNNNNNGINKLFFDLNRAKLKLQSNNSKENNQKIETGQLNNILEKDVNGNFYPQKNNNNSQFDNYNNNNNNNNYNNNNNNNYNYNNNNNIQEKDGKNEDEKGNNTGQIEPPEIYFCPITHELLRDPVTTKHGHTFERVAITEHINRGGNCPFTRKPLKIEELAPNYLVKQMIEKWVEEHPDYLVSESESDYSSDEITNGNSNKKELDEIENQNQLRNGRFMTGPLDQNYPDKLTKEGINQQKNINTNNSNNHNESQNRKKFLVYLVTNKNKKIKPQFRYLILENNCLSFKNYSNENITLQVREITINKKRKLKINLKVSNKEQYLFKFDIKDQYNDFLENIDILKKQKHEENKQLHGFLLKNSGEIITTVLIKLERNKLTIDPKNFENLITQLDSIIISRYLEYSSMVDIHLVDFNQSFRIAFVTLEEAKAFRNHYNKSNNILDPYTMGKFNVKNIPGRENQIIKQNGKIVIINNDVNNNDNNNNNNNNIKIKFGGGKCSLTFKNKQKITFDSAQVNNYLSRNDSCLSELRINENKFLIKFQNEKERSDFSTSLKSQHFIQNIIKKNQISFPLQIINDGGQNPTKAKMMIKKNKIMLLTETDESFVYFFDDIVIQISPENLLLVTILLPKKWKILKFLTPWPQVSLFLLNNVSFCHSIVYNNFLVQVKKSFLWRVKQNENIFLILEKSKLLFNLFERKKALLKEILINEISQCSIHTEKLNIVNVKLNNKKEVQIYFSSKNSSQIFLQKVMKYKK
ncbi:wd repeat [Anaeramoeba flamelloides]|uniref:RING-type E3 ubiquitin transferase n=1 Tax=Anaeramoeba flamelloides TaxID=1746091 RepID=A0ABQ8Y715_9EUKA|nr:wd repeat [Anaeramoeba flamelloides]